MNIKTKAYNFLKDIEKSNNISLISLTVANKDDVLFDFKKAPYLKDGKQLVFSVTKSFVSIAFGMAYDQGLIGLDDYIIDYFKDELPNEYDPKISEIRVKHVLTMTTGITEENNFEMLKADNWTTYFLSKKVNYKPGTHYHYHSATSHMISALFTKVTKTTVSDYLKVHLFEPLNIKGYQFFEAPEGITFGGYGLSIDNDGLVKLGQLLLNEGTYKGRRYISKAYLDLATTPQAVKQDFVDNPDVKSIGYQYGFQFHVSPNQSYRADGAYGQVVVIYNDLAIITTAQFVDYEYLYEMIYKHFTKEAVTKVPDLEIDAYFDTLTFTKNVETVINPIKGIYSFETNSLNILSAEFSNDYIIFNYKDGKKDKIDFNLRQDSYGKSCYVKDLEVVKQPHWVNVSVKNSELILNIFYIETPFIARYGFEKVGEKLQFTFNPSPNFLVNGFVVESI